MSKKGIAIVGRMAAGVELLDGQTVKTKVLCEELRRRFPDREQVWVDTYEYRKHAVPILRNTLRAFVKCDHIFVLLSRNGRKFFFPLLTGLNRIFRRRLYHDVVGGALPAEAAQSEGLRRQLKQFEVNWVEFEAMKAELEALGISNAEVLPNFKRLNILSPGDLSNHHEAPFVFSMFSRVTKEKGMTAAAEAVAQVNRRAGKTVAMLRIYGPVEASYRAEFQEILDQFSSCVSYLGSIPQEQSVETLRDSFMLLFPSVYPGEGMPGTIIDAFSAGLPVIATDWHFNAELVRSGETGYCYNWTQPELLAEHILHAVSHPEEVNAMRPACLAEAAKYTPEAVMEQICGRMGE